MITSAVQFTSPLCTRPARLRTNLRMCSQLHIVQSVYFLRLRNCNGVSFQSFIAHTHYTFLWISLWFAHFVRNNRLCLRCFSTLKANDVCIARWFGRVYCTKTHQYRNEHGKFGNARDSTEYTFTHTHTPHAVRVMHFIYSWHCANNYQIVVMKK